MKLTIAVAAVAVAIAISGCNRPPSHNPIDFYGSCAGNRACMNSVANKLNKQERNERIRRAIVGVGNAISAHGRAIERNNRAMQRNNRTVKCSTTKYGNSWSTTCR